LKNGRPDPGAAARRRAGEHAELKRRLALVTAQCAELAAVSDRRMSVVALLLETVPLDRRQRVLFLAGDHSAMSEREFGAMIERARQALGMAEAL
jgi:hypothetical protein